MKPFSLFNSDPDNPRGILPRQICTLEDISNPAPTLGRFVEDFQERFRYGGSQAGVGVILAGPREDKAKQARAAMVSVMKTYVDTSAEYLHCSDFVEKETKRPAYDDGTGFWLPAETSLVVLDGLGEEVRTPESSAMVMRLLRIRVRNARPTIIVSSVLPYEWPKVYGESAGRFFRENFDLSLYGHREQHTSAIGELIC
jgi:hypothetical protein